MTYIPGFPQPSDIPAQNQPDFLTNYGTLNSSFGVDHIPFGNPISAATIGNPARVTSGNHLLSTGDTVEIYGLNGLSGKTIIPWSVNGSSTTVTVINANTFDLDSVDSSGENTYIPNSGGFNVTATANPALPYPYGFHKKISFQDALNTYPDGTPNLASPISSLFTLLFNKKLSGKDTSSVELFFQNTSTDQLVDFLTNHKTKYTVSSSPNAASFFSVITPWHITLNMGQVFLGTQTEITLPLPTGHTYAAGGHYTTVMVAKTGFFDGNRTQFLVTALTDTSFTYKTNGTNGNLQGYFISIGKTA